MQNKAVPDRLKMCITIDHRHNPTTKLQ